LIDALDVEQRPTNEQKTIFFRVNCRLDLRQFWRRQTTMSATNDYPLLGSYSPPSVRVGDRSVCQIRGRVEIVGLTDARIPWPIGRKIRNGDHSTATVLCGDLVEALKKEATGAVCYWWGVSQITVWRWRKALGIKGKTEGTRRAKRAAVRKLAGKRRGLRVREETRRLISEAQRIA
jgi:hypothetical protein